jgi:shikimate kinase
MMTLTADDPNPLSSSPKKQSLALESLTWQPQRITLTGFMGCGKTTLGKKLAYKLGYPIVDTDKKIQQQTQQPIASLFEAHGEPYFRQLEADMLQHCLNLPQAVIATGGGALVQQHNLSTALAHSLVVYIEMPPQELFERVIFSPKERPLIDVPNAEETFFARFNERLPFYSQAHLTLNTLGLRPEQAVAKLLEALRHYTQNTPAHGLVAYPARLADEAVL